VKPDLQHYENKELRASVDSALGKISGPKRKKVTGSYKQLTMKSLIICTLQISLGLSNQGG
jgi:hypothetical protein